MPDPTAVAVLAAFTLAYAAGVRRAWAEAGHGRIVKPWQAACFAGGVAVTALAVASPLDSSADTDLVTHMVQHVLLIAVAPPLLAVGAVVPALVAALPRRRRAAARSMWRRVLRTQSSGAGWVAWATIGLVAQTAAMWVWHVPALYDAAVRSAPVHALEHASYLVSGTVFWWAIAGGRRSRHGAATLVVFIAGFPGTALGAALLLAPQPWYPLYATGSRSAAMGDQQMAGAVMWSIGGLVYVVAAAVLVATWLASGSTDGPRGGRTMRRAAVTTFLVLGTIGLVACGPKQFSPVHVVTGGDERVGKRLIGHYDCGRCHEIPGVKGANGLVGPPLTKFGRRGFIAGELANTPNNLIRWVQDPQAVEPGVDMPDLGVTPVEARHIAAYLESLG